MPAIYLAEKVAREQKKNYRKRAKYDTFGGPDYNHLALLTRRLRV